MAQTQYRVCYFAAAREAAGNTDAETIPLPSATNVATLATALANAQLRHPALKPLLARCVVALNQTYVDPEADYNTIAVGSGDELAIIPPVSGG
ncbi:hypothetical protein H4R35_001764 [Dimargaris xerosporica]|nr:hypothetical protein H4R35_001764 [Dimargaris xerosporica]